MNDCMHMFSCQRLAGSRSGWRGLARVLVWMACLPGAFVCAQAPEHSVHVQDPVQTEQRLAHIRQELSAIARERRQLESQRGAAARKLRHADEQVATAVRALRQIDAQLHEDQVALDSLSLRRSGTDSRLGELRAELARLMRQRYTRSERSALKRLFDQAQGVGSGRALTYHDYLQHYLQRRITTLQGELDEMEQLEREIAEHRRTLETTRSEQQQRTRELERERQTRAQTRAALDSRYADHTARERALGQDARALEALLSRLREAAVRPGGSGSGLAAAPLLQPGALSWPLNGPLLQRYGHLLADGRRSTGLLIDAPLGAPVHAVADGTVVFSEWMTGYGMLLIIDHGHAQMSLYAHNESLLKQAGDQIRRGDVIASVGHSGGQDSTALYFELRHEGRPVDPEPWLH